MSAKAKFTANQRAEDRQRSMGRVELLSGYSVDSVTACNVSTQGLGIQIKGRHPHLKIGDLVTIRVHRFEAVIDIPMLVRRKDEEGEGESVQTLIGLEQNPSDGKKLDLAGLLAYLGTSLKRADEELGSPWATSLSISKLDAMLQSFKLASAEAFETKEDQEASKWLYDPHGHRIRLVRASRTAEERDKLWVASILIESSFLTIRLEVHYDPHETAKALSITKDKSGLPDERLCHDFMQERLNLTSGTIKAWFTRNSVADMRGVFSGKLPLYKKLPAQDMKHQTADSTKITDTWALAITGFGEIQFVATMSTSDWEVLDSLKPVDEHVAAIDDSELSEYYSE